MSILNATKARSNFYKLIEETIKNHEPTFITGKKGNVVMLSEEDYKSMEETLHLSSIPGMEKKIVEGINTPLDECVTDDE